MINNEFKNTSSYYSPPSTEEKVVMPTPEGPRRRIGPLTRRDAIAMGIVAATAGTAFATADRWAGEGNSTSQVPITDQESTGVVEEEKMNNNQLEIVNFPHIFEDEIAQEIAEQCAIDTMKLVAPGYELSDIYTGFKDDELLAGTFHPQVYTHKDLIYRMADEFQLPPNVIAFFMSVESGGNPHANSGAAVGIFQLNQDYYIQDLSEEEWSKPENCAAAAAEAIQASLNGARDYLGVGEDDMSPNVLIRAAVMYNAGVSGGSKEYEELSLESQQYAQHAKRFILTAEISSRLRQSGYANRDVVESLCSPAVDARAYALSMYTGALPLDEALWYLGQDPLEAPTNADEEQLFAAYTAFPEGYFSMPLSPWLRIHTSINTGFVLGVDYAYNNDATHYFDVVTQR